MAKHVRRTFAYACDACSREVEQDELFRIAPFDFDLCQPCLGRPFGSVLSDVSPNHQLERPYAGTESE